MTEFTNGFVVGMALGIGLGFIIFTSVGRRGTIALASKATGIVKEELEKRIEALEKTT